MPSPNTLQSALGGAFLTLGLCVVGVAQSPAAAADPCTASNLANTVSSVSGAAGQYLATHPDVDQALTAAGQAPDSQGAVRTYFLAHPREFLDLRALAKPLTDLKAQCNATVSPAQVSALFQALSG